MPEDNQDLELDQTGDTPADEVDTVELAGQVTELARQIRSTQGENESLKRQLEETRHNLEYFSRKATEGPAPKQEADDEPDGEVVVDMLAKPGGLKKFAKLMNELGLVSKDEIDAREARIRNEGKEWGQLAQDYPGLADRSSELFKAASPLFEKYQKQYPTAGEAVIYRLAAAEATAQLGTADADKEAREADRQRRVKAQGGKINTGNKGAPSQVIPEGSARMAAKLGLPASEIGAAMKAHGHLIGEARGA
jgi:hypothetical protein